MAGPTHPDHIGGGRVTRSFRMGERHMRSGEMLTREQLLGMHHQNRAALIEKNFIQTWPRDVVVGVIQAAPAPVAAPAPTATPMAGEKLHVVNGGFGKWNVIKGVLLNDEPLTRAAAHELAGLPPPEAEKKTG